MRFNYSLEDLIIAYRKVKTDIYFDDGYDNLTKLSLYEEDLMENLKRLRSRLLHNDLILMESTEFLGDYRYILKNIEFENNETEDKKSFVFFSNQLSNWDEVNIKKMSFRYIGYHSIDFHIIASLWIDKVGIGLEKILSEKSYGSRLKRPNQQFNKFIPNRYSSDDPSLYKNINGHFRPYYWDYKRWQEDGIKSIEEALKKEKDVVVMTADITKFYHSISADFLIDPRFYSFLNDKGFSEEIHPLTRLMVDLLNQWSNSNLNRISSLVLKNKDHCGLPVGLCASKIIANSFPSIF